MNAISAAFAVAGVPHTVEEILPLGEFIRVAPLDAKAAVRVAKAQCDMDYYIDVFGIDTGEGVDVVIHLRSFAQKADLIIKSLHPYGGTWASIWEDFPPALMPERELCEMFGLKLAGHPNPKRLLTTDGIEPPLLKSTLLRTVEEVRGR